MIYAICSGKGGSGKSTTAGAILSGATMRGRRALAIDADPQSNLTFSTGADGNRAGTWEILTGKKEASDVIQHTQQGDVIAAGPMLATADTVLQKTARYKRLNQSLRGLQSFYDVAIIDVGPTTNTILLNALTAADRVIIPTTATAYSLQGLVTLMQVIHSSQKDYNHGLRVAGILFTMYNARANITRTYTQAIEDQAKKWKIPVLKTRIRRGVAVEESQTARKSIFTYSPRSNPAKDYSDLLDELGI